MGVTLGYTPAKVGLMGGTFDPIHLGHLLIAEEARDSIGLDKVVFVPAGEPQLKNTETVTASKHRFAMVELAVRSNRNFQVSDIEVLRSGPSYTVDTLDEFRDHYGIETELFLIMGTDSLSQLNQWRHPDRLFEMCTVVVISRAGHENVNIKKIDTFVQGASSKVISLPGPGYAISATEIRNRVALHKTITYRVPDVVEAYIQDYGLYECF